MLGFGEFSYMIIFFIMSMLLHVQETLASSVRSGRQEAEISTAPSSDLRGIDPKKFALSLYEETVSKEELLADLVQLQRAERLTLSRLKEVSKQHAAAGGPIPPTISDIQSVLIMIAQKRHQIGAIVQYQKNQELVNHVPVTRDMQKLLDRQSSAYKEARELQERLSLVHPATMFDQIRAYLRLRMDQCYTDSFEAGKEFYKKAHSDQS